MRREVDNAAASCYSSRRKVKGSARTARATDCGLPSPLVDVIRQHSVDPGDGEWQRHEASQREKIRAVSTLISGHWPIVPFGAIVNANPGSSPLPGVVVF